jgi:hypothetical protein
MAMYIQVENGLPVNHPALEENLIASFGMIPEGWEPFVRTAAPKLGPYQYMEPEQHSYAKVEGVWTDVWVVFEFTAEQKQRRQQRKKDAWASQPYAENFTTWIFNEEKCQFEAPVAYPDEDGKLYAWSGANNAWIETVPPPVTGKDHEFDFNRWIWVEV